MTAPADAIGLLSDDNLSRWFLAIQRKGAPSTEFTIITEGTTPFLEGVIAQIDPTMLLNGFYSVVLQATGPKIRTKIRTPTKFHGISTWKAK